jgi:hypothetical protein
MRYPDAGTTPVAWVFGLHAQEHDMDDTFRYLRVFTLLGLTLAAAIIGVRHTVQWTLSAEPYAWTADDRHLRLSVEERKTAEYDSEPYKSGKFQAQYEKL